jgi:hypothetical protein
LVGRVGVEALVPGWSGAGFIGVELTLEKKRNSFKMYIFFLLKAQELTTRNFYSVLKFLIKITLVLKNSTWLNQ